MIKHAINTKFDNSIGRENTMFNRLFSTNAFSRSWRNWDIIPETYPASLSEFSREARARRLVRWAAEGKIAFMMGGRNYVTKGNVRGRPVLRNNYRQGFYYQQTGRILRPRQITDTSQMTATEISMRMHEDRMLGRNISSSVMDEINEVDQRYYEEMNQLKIETELKRIEPRPMFISSEMYKQYFGAKFVEPKDD